MVYTQAQLEEQIQEWGFMPFFHNSIEGFSIEDIMPADLLFGEMGDTTDGGAWQWKGPIIMHWQAAYGKFFAGKAGFVSLSWLPDFMNWRRHLMPLDSFPADARTILRTLQQNESMLSKQLKTASGFSLTRKRFSVDADAHLIRNHHNGPSFDALIARLQMGTHVCIADFEYSVSKKGETYGWGVARYCTPEAMYDLDFTHLADNRTPAESRQRIIDHLARLFPSASHKSIEKLV